MPFEGPVSGPVLSSRQNPEAPSDTHQSVRGAPPSGFGTVAFTIPAGRNIFWLPTCTPGPANALDTHSSVTRASIRLRFHERVSKVCFLSLLAARIKFEFILVPLFDECFFFLVPLLRARCGGSTFCYLRLPGRKSGSPRFCLPQERDATLSKSTSVRSDGHLVRRRNVAEADREHALCERDDWSHYALPLESGGGVDDVQSARQRDIRSKVAYVHDQTALGAAIDNVADHDLVSGRLDDYGHGCRRADQIRSYGAGCRHLEDEALCWRKLRHCTRGKEHR